MGVGRDCRRQFCCLDPNQLLEIRKLIKDIGAEKTVLFSSHIMQEVQSLCDRVIIINQGKIVADDSIEMLAQYQKKEFLISVEFENLIEEKILAHIDGVLKIKTHDSNKAVLICDRNSGVRKAIFNSAIKHNNA